MLDEILVDSVTTAQAENHPPFATTIDYDVDVMSSMIPYLAHAVVYCWRERSLRS